MNHTKITNNDIETLRSFEPIFEKFGTFTTIRGRKYIKMLLDEAHSSENTTEAFAPIFVDYLKEKMAVNRPKRTNESATDRAPARAKRSRN